MNSKIKRGLAAVGALAVATGLTLALSGSSNASVPKSTAGLQSSGAYLNCVKNTTPNLNYVIAPNNGLKTCPSPYSNQLLAGQAEFLALSAKVAAIKPVPGSTGAKGATGETGPQGPAGPAGSAAIVSIDATTNVSNWDESSGWATDAFTRELKITDNGAADSSNCGNDSLCHLYTFTLTDNGSFLTKDGADSPNGSATKIGGVFQGSMNGAADGQFYAAPNSLKQGNIPISATKATAGVTTSTWPKLGLVDGTKTYGMTLVRYGWTYGLNIVAGAGCPTTVSQSWNDQIKPGDDGQSAADGNITGSNGC